MQSNSLEKNITTSDSLFADPSENAEFKTMLTAVINALYALSSLQIESIAPHLQKLIQFTEEITHAHSAIAEDVSVYMRPEKQQVEQLLKNIRTKMQQILAKLSAKTTQVPLLSKALALHAMDQLLAIRWYYYADSRLNDALLKQETKTLGDFASTCETFLLEQGIKKDAVSQKNIDEITSNHPEWQQLLTFYYRVCSQEARVRA